nr:hypothetical protein [Clostridia bacterium]
MKKLSCLLAVLIVIAAILASCSSSGETAMSYGNQTVTDRMYRYWATQFKEYVMSSFSDSEDTDSFWNAQLENGMTMEEYADAIVLANVKKNLVCMKLFDEYSLKVSDEAYAAIDSDIADLVDSYGSKAALNADLANSGINVDILREIYVIQEKIAAVYSYMTSSGLISPSDDELEKYYTDHYARIKYITIIMSNITEGENGKVNYSSLSEEERAVKEGKIAAVLDELEGGADFDKVMDKYNEYDMTGYENGVYISTNNAGYAIIDEALSMEIGEVRRIDQDSACYIVKRLELEKKPYLDDKMGQFSDLAAYCADEVFQNTLTEMASEITVNEDVIGRFEMSGLYY